MILDHHVAVLVTEPLVHQQVWRVRHRLHAAGNDDVELADANELVGESDLDQIHPNMPDFVQRMVKAALGLGVVTTEVDGQWYVSPLRSYSSVFTDPEGHPWEVAHNPHWTLTADGAVRLA